MSPVAVLHPGYAVLAHRYASSAANLCSWQSNGDGDTDDVITTDARGFARDVYFDGTPPTPDLGAFEQQNDLGVVVTTLSDAGADATVGGNLAAEQADGGGLSLREALLLVNAGDLDADPTNGTRITFDAALAGGTLFLATGQQLAITTDGITVDGDIDGNGTADIDISADSEEGANDAGSRVFFISGAGDGTIAATLNGLVIRDGNSVVVDAAGFGGAIYVGLADALALTNATVSGNSADSGGGGIFGVNDSSITLTNATVSGNSAESFGGGIFGGNDSSITLTNATVSGNSARFSGGGGLAGADDSSITLTNATVSDNSAGTNGGGIYGAFNCPVVLTNSIVAGNAAALAGDDLFGAGPDTTLTFAGGNILGSAASGFGGGVSGPTPTTIVGTSPAALATVFAAVANNPTTGVLSGVLADNGGAVETIAILRNGIAQNAGDTALLPDDTADLDGDTLTDEPLPFDARGLPRVAFSDVDLGAFEIQNAAPVITSDGGGAAAAVAVAENTVLATTVTAADPDAGTTLAFSIVGGDDAARFQIHATTGELSFIAAPDFEDPTDADGDNGYIVQVRASDGALFDDQTITVNVTDVASPSNDFNGDERSDILWRHDSGGLASWELDSGVIFHYHFLGGVDPSYSVDAVADFDGNGTADALWRHDTGFIITWDINHGDQTGYHAIGPSNPADEIEGTGDFNGDGHAELLWRNADTGVVTWQLNTGPFVDTVVNGDEIEFTRDFGPVTGDWTIVGIGDVNGDGNSDIFWRHDSGQLVSWEIDDGSIIGYNDYGHVGNDYQFIDTGDFNGDGRSGDIVWRHASGQVVTWELDGATQVGYHDFGNVTTDYTIEDTGDYNGDGHSDILWRHDSGQVITWELDGGAIIGYHDFGNVDPVWQIQP